MSENSSSILIAIIVLLLVGIGITVLFYGVTSGTTIYRADVVDFWNTLFWVNIPDKPTSFIPSLHSHSLTFLNISGLYYHSHTLSALNISSGTFGNNRLDLSALAQNITFTSTQTVDGIDISAYINQAVLTSSSPTFNHIHSSAIGSILTGSGAIYSGTPTLLLEDTSVRATLVLSSTTDTPLDINLRVNGATRWDISSRGASSNYDLIFYRWKTITPCLILSYDTGLVTLEGALKMGSIITLPNEAGLWWTNSTGYAKNIMRLNGANNIILNTQPTKSWLWYSSAPDYYANFVIYDNGNVDVRGILTALGGLVTRYMSGDYGLTWTQTMPTGINGMMVTVYNSNAGILSSRWYVYSNSVWRYTALT